MIFRRLKAHVEKENWFAVAIDFAIVVIGVFIGIQVANWNAAQNDRAREQEYYVQMLGDLRADVAMAQIVAFDARQFDTHGDYLQKALSTPNFVIEDPDYFALSVARAGYTRFPVINRRTIDELESIGGLTLLTDRRVKEAVLDYYSATTNTDQWNMLLREMQYFYKEAHAGLLSREIERQIATKLATFDPVMESWEYERRRMGPDGLGVDLATAQSILQRARNREKLADALSLMEAVHSRMELRAEYIEDRANALIEIIEDHIDAPLAGQEDMAAESESLP